MRDIFNDESEVLTPAPVAPLGSTVVNPFALPNDPFMAADKPLTPAPVLAEVTPTAITFTRNPVEIAGRIVAIKAQLELQKPLYEELDNLTLELKAIVGVDAEVMANGSFVTVVDNFAEKNTVFRPAGVKHFDVSLETFQEREEAQAKAAAKAAKGKKKGS